MRAIAHGRGRSLWYDVVVVAEKSMRKVSVDPENIMCCKLRLVIYTAFATFGLLQQLQSARQLVWV